MKRYLLALLFSTLAYGQTDTATLEKRVAVLEAEVAALKSQKAEEQSAAALDEAARKRLVAAEIRRRKAIKNGPIYPAKEARAEPVSFRLIDSPVLEVAQWYADLSRKQVTISPNVASAFVSVTGEELSSADAITKMDAALERAGIRVSGSDPIQFTPIEKAPKNVRGPNQKPNDPTPPATEPQP